MRRLRSKPEAGLAGLVSGAVALTSAMVMAGLASTISPLDAVGGVVIDHVPAGVKDWAIDRFGTNDKAALKVGIVVIAALAAIALGLVARHRRRLGATGIAAFGVIGALAAASRANHSLITILAPLAGSIVGGALLLWLMRPLGAQMPGESRVPLGLDRRGFLRASGIAGATAAVAGGASAALEAQRLDRARRAIQRSLPQAVNAPTGTQPALDQASTQFYADTPYITPNADFYRIDTALSFPSVDVATWTLSVDGMVERPITLSYADLLARPRVTRTVTLACVSNYVGGPYIGNAVWEGVLLRDLLAEAGVQNGAEQLFSTSIDGWTCGFPISVAADSSRDCMVAVGMNGGPLPLTHGFPARLVVPGLYGYVSATKWLSTITLNRWSDAQGYWVPRGWSRDAPIKTQSRVDVPRGGAEVQRGTVRIAGIAWAPHRGVAKVEVRIDDGEWAQATLARADNDDTWVQWVYDWDATTAKSGNHSATVRATDRSGETQTAKRSEPDPDGATGHHTKAFKLV